MEHKYYKGVLCTVRISEGEVFVTDETDEYNEPAMYTTSKRGIKKLFARIEKDFSVATTTLAEVQKWCQELNIRTHQYCRMD